MTNGIARLGNGILISRVTGATDLAPSYIGYATNWLPLAKVQPEVGQKIIEFYLNHKPAPGPKELARLLLYARASR